MLKCTAVDSSVYIIHLDSPASITLPIETLYGLQQKKGGQVQCARVRFGVRAHAQRTRHANQQITGTYILQFWQPKTHIEPMMNQINPNPCTKL